MNGIDFEKDELLFKTSNQTSVISIYTDKDNDYSKKIKDFNIDDAILAGIESRTSSPIRIVRNESYESNIKGIYPCGEGSGYSGGITTSAIDGIKVAEQIIKKYNNT